MRTSSVISNPAKLIIFCEDRSAYVELTRPDRFLLIAL